jgi:hypothetical protein
MTSEVTNTNLNCSGDQTPTLVMLTERSSDIVLASVGILMSAKGGVRLAAACLSVSKYRSCKPNTTDIIFIRFVRNRLRTASTKIIFRRLPANSCHCIRVVYAPL